MKQFVDGEMVTGWCTKHALTFGIEQLVGHWSGGYVYAASKLRHRGTTTRMTIGVTFFLTREEAAAKAKEMAGKELKRLALVMGKLKDIQAKPRFV